MKKLLTILLSAILTLTVAVGLTACSKPTQSGNALNLYCPDGAPALSVARLSEEDTAIENLKVNVVDASLISSYVTGEAPKADFAIMPVNAAVKLLGKGDKYKMLGTVTNGNLFLMKKPTGVDISKDNLTQLVGKKVGVINLANIPGLTFKAILTDNNIPFIDITEGGEASADKVNLVGLKDGTFVVPTSTCDYFVVPEPAATTKQNKTNGKLSICGSLQALYGQGNGYPQAVLVGKISAIENDSKITDLLVSSFTDNAKFLTESTSETIVNAVIKGFVDSGKAPTFTADNLNAQVIANCAINFTSATASKVAVNNYIEKINAFSNSAWGSATDNFFYAK